MKSKVSSKRQFFCECILEKCMEWIDFLRYNMHREKGWKSNLTESYNIHKEHMGKDFVRDFLSERKRQIERNGYKMEINELPEKAPENIIGKVVLYRKKEFIHSATLKTKGEEQGCNTLIFWSFDNN